ncbi:glycosyltransferase family 2 protein [Paracoccus sp. p4-l81]|uniref:glycosyltransferase family 2 protein n=1 Tax=unclassified Paracoccus (in: a-proteobacteria) TaxID=2688777 RepID=UPI0035B70F98
MGLVQSYMRRVERRQLLWRGFRSRHALRAVTDRTPQIRPRDLLVLSTIRNEAPRLPYFLDYYRARGVNWFLIVDNDSDDGGREWLAEQPDVSLWTTKASYKDARFGMDWLTWLLIRHGHGHWCLTVDPDEFLIYPFCDTRPLRALTDWLDSRDVPAFPAMLLDMYPKGPIDAHPYTQGSDPMQIARWFDAGNYTISRNKRYGNLWIQGGPRARMFFADNPRAAPALNKIPLVRWNRRYAYVSSTHMLLPRGLNAVYDTEGGERASGLLLHTKFLSVLGDKVTEEMARQQHYADSREYYAYSQQIGRQPDLWCPASQQYVNWRQLEILGLMSKGDWA